MNDSIKAKTKVLFWQSYNEYIWVLVQGLSEECICNTKDREALCFPSIIPYMALKKPYTDTKSLFCLFKILIRSGQSH